MLDRSWFLALVLAVSSGCTEAKSESKPTTTDAAVIDAAEASAPADARTIDPSVLALATVQCSREAECGLLGWAYLYPTFDACVTAFANYIELTSGATDSRTTSADLDKCAAAHRAATCAQITDPAKDALVTPCAVVPGARAIGKPCWTDTQCQSGRCSRERVCGKCVKVAAEGDYCSESGLEPCAAGLQCAAHTCVRGRRLGETCDLAEAPCTYSYQCVAKVCVLPAKVGEKCSLSGDSLPDCGDVRHFYCDASTGTCRRYVDRNPGETCDLSLSERCTKSSYCKDGKCVARVRDGETCTAPEWCHLFSTCNEAKVCAPFVAPACDG